MLGWSGHPGHRWASQPPRRRAPRSCSPCSTPQMGAAAHAHRAHIRRPVIIQSSDAGADCQLQECSAVRCVMTGSLANRLASLCRMGKVINSSLVLDEVLDVVLDNLIEL